MTTIEIQKEQIIGSDNLVDSNTTDSLRKKFWLQFFCFFLPALIFITIMHVVIIIYENNAMTEVIHHQEKLYLLKKAEHVFNKVEGVIADLLNLSENHELEAFFANKNKHHLRLATGDFFYISKVRGRYAQIRFIDLNGAEIIRIDKDVKQSPPIKKPDVQNQLLSRYFKESIVLGHGEVYISSFYLENHTTGMEKPLIPIIYFGTPVFDSSGNLQGCIIINYKAEDLIGSHVQNPAYFDSDGRMNKNEANWLIGISGEKPMELSDYNGQIPQFESLFPNMWKTISTTFKGQVDNSLGLLTYFTVYPGVSEDEKSRKMIGRLRGNETTSQAKIFNIKVISRLPQMFFDQKARDLHILKLPIYFILLALFGFFSLVIARSNIRLVRIFRTRGIFFRKQGEMIAKLKQNVFSAIDNQEEYFSRITETVSKTIDTERVSIWMFNNDQSQLECRDLFEKSLNTHTQNQRAPKDILQKAVKAFYMNKINENQNKNLIDAIKRNTEAAYKKLNISAVLLVPIFAGKKVIGVLSIGHKGGSRQWTLDERLFATYISEFVSVAYSNNEQKKGSEELEQHRNQLEEQVNNRTRELSKANKKLEKEIRERNETALVLKTNIENLERFSRLSYGREERMIQLKEEVNYLLGQLRLPEKYKPNS